MMTEERKIAFWGTEEAMKYLVAAGRSNPHWTEDGLLVFG